MQSGTILHLALLKKLSCSTPHCNYAHKFARFRNNIRSRTPNMPCRSNTSIIPFQKYSSNLEKSENYPKTARSLRSYRGCQIKKEVIR